MEIFTKENGKMIRLMGMEFTHIKMEQNMMANGWKISSTETVWKRGLMEQSMKESI